MIIKCILCSGDFEDTDSGIQQHFAKEHHPIENGLMYYVVRLQKRIENLEKRS